MSVASEECYRSRQPKPTPVTFGKYQRLYRKDSARKSQLAWQLWSARQIELAALKRRQRSVTTAWLSFRLQTVEKNPGPEAKRLLTGKSRRTAEMAKSVVEVLIQWLELFGFDSKGYSSAGDIIQWTEWFSSEDGWLKVAKYKIAAFYQEAQKHLLLDTELPPRPKGVTGHPLHLLGGRAGRFFRRMIRKSNPSRHSFLSSLLLTKGGMPRPGKQELREALKKTVASLTNPRARDTNPVRVPGSSLAFRHSTLTLTELKDRTCSRARELFCRERWNSRTFFSKTITPSFSANMVRSRREFGTFGELEDLGMLDTQRRQHLRLRPKILEEHIGLDVQPVLELTGLEATRQQFLSTYFDALRAAMHEEPIAEGVSLAEALKVRVITKGPPLTQYVLKPMQEWMWRVLKQHPAFRLIGEPVDVSNLAERLKPLTGDQAWLSGDYSDATNQLHPDLSCAVWDTICEITGVPRALQELGKRVLTDHWIVVSQPKEERALMPQQWGQLMGSIISFPILCIVNATVCALAIEHDLSRPVTLDEANMMINGDDCLLAVGPRGYNAWKTYGKMAGLSPSTGKVYYSREFCNINSTTFEYLWDDVDYTNMFVRVPVVRLGLCFGLKRSVADTEKEDADLATRLLGNGVEWDSSVGAQHRALMFECPVECRTRVHKKFIARNRKLLDAAAEYGMPWYVPECYGGVGLEPVGDSGPSHEDQLIVAAMVHWRAWTTKQPPLPVQWKGASKTRIHQVALDALTEALGEVETHWVPQGSAEIDGLDSPSLNSWVIYQRPEDVLTAPDEVRFAVDALSKNRKCRHWYLRHMKRFAWMTPGPCPPRRLVHDVRIVERTVPTLPSESDIALREVESLLDAVPKDGVPRIILSSNREQAPPIQEAQEEMMLGTHIDPWVTRLEWQWGLLL